MLVEYLYNPHLKNYISMTTLVNYCNWCFTIFEYKNAQAYLLRDGFMTVIDDFKTSVVNDAKSLRSIRNVLRHILRSAE